MKDFEYEDRICECCFGSNLEELWSFTYVASGRSDRYRFNVRDVICHDCGFVFVTPAPTAESLTSFYSDLFPLWEEMKPDFDVETRLRFIQKHLHRSSCIIELGSGKLGEFQRRLCESFSKVVTMDVDQTVVSDHHSMLDLSKTEADMVVHYFVLEHVTHVGEFIDHCARLLKEGGMMICEVPDLGRYPTDPSGLTVYSHTNHFTVSSLTRIARKSGFQLLEADVKNCSRPFGFSAAFMKTSPTALDVGNSYRENRDLFLRGVENAKESEEALDDAWIQLEEFTSRGCRILFWVANECLSRFLKGRALPVGIRVVDSNPAKKGFSSEFEICLPAEVAGDITESDVIFIFSKIHSEDILSMAERDFGKTWTEEKTVVVSDLP